MSRKQPTSVDVPVYLVVEPTWSGGRDGQGRPILGGGKVVKHTVTPPSLQRSGVAVKITLRIPASSFLPLQPEAVVVLRETDIETVVVEAEHPEYEDED